MACRGEPIVLKIYAALQCAIYAHDLCLTDRADFCGVRKRSISDGQIGPANGSNELAVLGKSLDSVGFSLSLTETRLVLLVAIFPHQAITDT